jgi:hypothetical protein
MDIHHIHSDGLIKTVKLIGSSYILRQNLELKILLGMKLLKNTLIQITPPETYLIISNQVRLLNGTSIFKLFHKWMVSNTDGIFSMLPK